MYLEKLEEAPNLSKVIYLRPGRFGKSLFTSMMEYYYSVDKMDKFDKLFEGLYIKEHPTKNKNNYYILKLDFSGVDVNDGDTIERMMRAFNSKVISGIEICNNRYGFNFEINKELSPAELIGEFFTYLQSLNLDKKIYVIIDEYDNFTNGILKGNAKTFLKILTEEGFIKGFYSRIKEAIGMGIVERFFATGVAPITLDSMTTGFNIATDITRNPDFISMIGFTEEETKELINRTLVNTSKEEQEKVLETMKSYYDGYRFSEENENHTFNSTLVMYYLNKYMKDDKPPINLLDMNVAADFSKLENLITLKNNNYYKDILTQCINKEAITGNIVNKFNLVDEVTEDSIKSLLFYFGYLTIDKNALGSKVSFKIPNYVMEGIYSDCFIKLNRGMQKVKILP